MEDVNFWFRRLVADAAQKLRAQEKRTLAFVYELPEDDGEKDGIFILNRLLMKGHFSAEVNPDGLVEVLKNAHRNDLAKESEKQIKKWRAKKSKKDKLEKTASTISETVDAAAPSLKRQFDELVEKAAHFVDQLRMLREEMAKRAEGHHRKAHELIAQCQESADAIQRSLKKARSDAELSDKTLAKKEKAKKEVVARLDEMTTKEVEDFVHGKSPFNPAQVTTALQECAESVKKPLLPHPRTPLTCSNSEPESGRGNKYEKSPLPIPERASGQGSLVTSERPKLESSPRSNYKPIPSPRQRTHRESKIPQFKPAKRRASAVPSTTSHTGYVNAREATAVYDSEDYTGSTTGDSGCDVAESFLKVDLKPEYTPLQTVTAEDSTDDDGYTQIR